MGPRRLHVPRREHGRRGLFGGVGEGEDIRTLLQVPGIDRDAVRDYFERHGLLELFDAIEKKS